LTKNLDTTHQGRTRPLAVALDTLPGGGPLELRDLAMAEMAREGALGAHDLAGLDLPDAPRTPAVSDWLARGRSVLAQDDGEPALFVSRTGRRLSASDVRRRLRAALPEYPSAQAPSISTTHNYLRVESTRLRKAYARAHPRA
jgi:integrase/recombinase XerC/integrase/recombinase XerD